MEGSRLLMTGMAFLLVKQRIFVSLKMPLVDDLVIASLGMGLQTVFAVVPAPIFSMGGKVVRMY